MKPKRTFALVVALPLAVCLAVCSCTQSATLRGQIAGLEKIVEQAERNGARRCAPRELAIARSQLEFATIELDQGFVSKAQAHLGKAEQNARAAELLSPAEHCSGRPAGDSDGDGYADPVDQCPTKPENYNGYQDEDGCPDDPDSDGDGIADKIVRDTDGDGVADVVALDRDFDGRIDFLGVDQNGDGDLDVVQTDTDGDGTLDRTTYSAE